MNKQSHQILAHVYKNSEVGVREVISMMARKFNDHRDFYGLAALIKEGYLGFNGPIYDDMWSQSKVFQCYSQGSGRQKYGGVEILGNAKSPELYIGGKGIIYFHELGDKQKAHIVVAILGLLAAIASGITVSKFSEPTVVVQKQIETRKSDNVQPKHELRSNK